MSCAALTSWARLGLDSKVCGSVLGLFRIDETCTYLPPIWERTSAYSFSAPMALTTPDFDEVDTEALVDPHAETTRPTRATTATAATPECPRMGRPLFLLVVADRM